MTEYGYLNVTRGTTLQTLCKEIADDLNQGTNITGIGKWIEDEKRNLRKKQTPLWEPTVSDQCYYRYLEMIGEGLAHGQDCAYFEGLCEEIKTLTRTKIRALFLTQEVSCWASLESLFAAAQDSSDFDTDLVYTPFFHKNFTEQVDYFDEYQEMGLPITRHNVYDLTAYSPDVVFMVKPYGNVPEAFQYKHLECVIPRAVYVPYGMEITTDLAKFGFGFYLHYKAWRHCAYGNVVKEFARTYGYRDGENVVVWGHPKADHYRDMEDKRKTIPEEWKQIIGDRKTILWSPHHLIDLNETGTGTWLIWGEQILELALNTPEIVFIFRPHPLMMGALVNSGSMTQAQADRLRQRIENAENIIWDTHSLYHYAFNAADAIISDGTTFCVEFLYTKKPILLTPRNMESFYIYEQMLESYYIANSMDDISRYVKMIRDGEDPLREKRLKLYRDVFFVPEEGTVGEYIMKQVKRDLETECGKKMNTATTAFGEVQKQKSRCSEQLDVDKKEFPLFSILVLCYKNMDLLFGMLDTIFVQDYPRIQLIVSDDGSADFDVEHVQAYIETNKRQNIEQVIVRKNEKNMRTVRHVHTALNFVQGEYLVLTAADDRFSGTGVISGYVEQFLRNPESVWLVARCHMTSADYKAVIYDTPTQTDAPYFESRDAQKLFSRWSRRGMAIPCCMAFRMDAFELVGGIDLDYQFLEDWPLELKLLRNGYAPIYYQEITAIHSTGGISNSNNRHGKEIKKLFYDDKYTIFRKEVEPYKHLMFPEDRKAYKQYLREIMARHYFFYIDWPEASIAERVKLFLKKPIRFWWVFEEKYSRVKDKIQRKKFFAASQGLFLVSMFLLQAQGSNLLSGIFRGMGYLDLVAAVLLFLVSTVSYPLEKYFDYKVKLRQKLVN